jgi:micrococcal nuclease
MVKFFAYVLLGYAVVAIGPIALAQYGAYARVAQHWADGSWPDGQGPTVLGQVTRVIDGDTLVVAGQGRVRLIGVDAPETNDPRPDVLQVALDATAFARSMAVGQRVTLRFDQQLKDHYGRVLAYVYLPDGRLLNAELLQRGLATLYSRESFRHMTAFRAMEREARSNRRGIWRTK